MRPGQRCRDRRSRRECAGDHPRQGDEISRALKQAGRVERLATLIWRCNMTSATTTPTRGMGRRHAERYGLIVLDHRGRRGRAMGPVCLGQPREPGCLALRCVDRPQLAGIVTSTVLASVAMVIASLNVAIRAFRTESLGEFMLWRYLLVPQRPPYLTTRRLFIYQPPGRGIGAPDQQTARRNPGGATNVRDHFCRSSWFCTARRIRRLRCQHRTRHDDPPRRTARSGSPVGNRAADHRARA